VLHNITRNVAHNVVYKRNLRSVLSMLSVKVIQKNWGFSSDPHQNSWNCIRGKISDFWAQQRWNFKKEMTTDTPAVWHDAIQIKGSVCKFKRRRSRGVAVTCYSCYANGFQFDSFFSGFRVTFTG